MSCWVVPTIAAEIWGIPVEQILRMIEAGEVGTLTERGWTFVDVAPESPVLQRREKPTTYTVVPVTEKEMEALAEVMEDEFEEDEGEVEAAQESTSFTHWRGARQRTGRLRLAPAKFQTI